MQVTVKKTLNGIEIHDQKIDELGKVIKPRVVRIAYKVEVPELGYVDTRHFEPILSATESSAIDKLIIRANTLIDAREI